MSISMVEIGEAIHLLFKRQICISLASTPYYLPRLVNAVKERPLVWSRVSERSLDTQY